MLVHVQVLETPSHLLYFSECWSFDNNWVILSFSTEAKYKTNTSNTKHVTHWSKASKVCFSLLGATMSFPQSVARWSRSWSWKTKTETESHNRNRKRKDIENKIQKHQQSSLVLSRLACGPALGLGSSRVTLTLPLLHATASLDIRAPNGSKLKSCVSAIQKFLKSKISWLKSVFWLFWVFKRNVFRKRTKSDASSSIAGIFSGGESSSSSSSPRSTTVVSSREPWTVSSPS